MVSLASGHEVVHVSAGQVSEFHVSELQPSSGRSSRTRY